MQLLFNGSISTISLPYYIRAYLKEPWQLLSDLIGQDIAVAVFSAAAALQRLELGSVITCYLTSVQEFLKSRCFNGKMMPTLCYFI